MAAPLSRLRRRQSSYSGTVQAGESFWSIAEQVAGPDATLQQVTQVWAGIVDANAGQLVQPGNPDLILPGQVMVLPGSASSP